MGVSHGRCVICDCGRSLGISTCSLTELAYGSHMPITTARMLALCSPVTLLKSPSRLSLRRFLTLAAAVSQSIASRSNSAVKRLEGPAHGSFTTFGPCSEQLVRGGAACRIVRYWQVSRCRQRRSG